MSKFCDKHLDLQAALEINETLCDLALILPNGDLSIEIRKLCFWQSNMYYKLVNGTKSSDGHLKKIISYCKEIKNCVQMINEENNK